MQSGRSIRQCWIEAVKIVDHNRCFGKIGVPQTFVLDDQSLPMPILRLNRTFD